MFQWGKASFHVLNVNFEKFARPRKLFKDVRAHFISVGLSHFMFVDSFGKLWTCGENKFGQLGNDETYVRRTPFLNRFFINRRIIDVTCGDGFTVVIAEDFNVTKEQST